MTQLSALEHLHTQGLVHRDIKPENILLCPSDPSRVRLIDFGLARRFDVPTRPQPSLPRATHAPLRHVMGTLHWCSVHAHRHLPLGPRDDLESLAYTLIFLACGDVPWRSKPREEPLRAAMTRIGLMKEQVRAGSLSFTKGLPPSFEALFTACTSLGPTDVPFYAGLHPQWPLWTPEPLDTTPIVARSLTDVGRSSPPCAAAASTTDSAATDPGGSDSRFTSSYLGWDLDRWDPHGSRSKSLTFPAEEAHRLDGQVPEIAVLEEDRVLPIIPAS